MTKLNKTKIKWLIRQVIRFHKRPEDIAPVYRITARRVRQLVQSFKKTGKMPELKQTRRPEISLTPEQIQTVDQVFNETRLGARLLYLELKSRGKPIPKNKLYEHLKRKGLVKPTPSKQKQRKRCRYERKHSGSLLHGDGHRTSVEHPYCMLWMDDASRKLLSGVESKTALTNRHSIQTMREAIQAAKEYNVIIQQANTDRGTEFYSNKKYRNPGSKSQFEQYLLSEGIKHIPSRVGNPQTNGKIERHWLEYDRHRWRFNSLKEYMTWYNNRLHGALNVDWGETPDEAFVRKMLPESMIGLMFK